MTTVLGRYVIAQVLIGTLFALLLLVTLDGVFALIGELGDVGRGQYGLWEAVVYVLLTLPRRVYELVPTAALLGSLLWLGNLASNSELTAMRAAGVTRVRLVSWVMQGGLVVVVGMVGMGELLAPEAEARAQHLKAFAFDERMTVGRIGLWARDGNRIVHADAVLPGDRLAGVRVIELGPTGDVRSITNVDRAEFQMDRWQLSGVARSRVSPFGVIPEKMPDEVVDRLLAPEYFGVLVVEPRQMAASDLARYIRYLKENHLESAAYEVAFWQRFVLPASTWVMLLLAIPFLFGSQREGGAGRRLFIGLVLGVGFVIVMRTMAHMGLVYEFPPWVAASIPLWLFLLIAVVALARVRG
ncbi:LPS export ABC transporter permease LptG [Thioalkalivibrio paradoxus]|uniref:Permease n=1 Tax=Thioalkalivibrio paradoxus ARh 1 TaxID=713585 RepID=W0DGM9_9GAMM|nr:LPS export ABC transporter permease LptG [Thioalkalivibrio paradoxus]AHE97536.1 permease [Thioalkalivibrio paradoxus ARh 1]